MNRKKIIKPLGFMMGILLAVMIIIVACEMQPDEVRDNPKDDKAENYDSTLDVYRPSAEITSHSNGYTYLDQFVTVSGIGSDTNVPGTTTSGLDKVFIRYGTNAFEEATGTSSWSKDMYLPEGMVDLEAYALDLAGNTSITDKISILVNPSANDTIRPDIFVTNLTNGQVLATNYFTLRGTADDTNTKTIPASGIYSIMVSIDGGTTYNEANGTTGWSHYIQGLTNGPHSVKVYAEDNQNNKSTTATINFSVDIFADDINQPIVSIASVSHMNSEDVVTNPTAFSITGTANDPTGDVKSYIRGVYLSTNGVSGPFTQVTGTNNWIINFSNVEPGYYDVRYYCDDHLNRSTTNQKQLWVAYPGVYDNANAKFDGCYFAP